MIEATSEQKACIWLGPKKKSLGRWIRRHDGQGPKVTWLQQHGPTSHTEQSSEFEIARPTRVATSTH